MLKFDFLKQSPKRPKVKIFSSDDFDFLHVHPNVERILEMAGKYSNAQNLVIIGRGGSISTFRALWESLGKYISDKKVYFVDTLDPDYIFYVKDKCVKEETLILVISKSGNTVDVIENLLNFQGYKQMVITEESKENTLLKIAREKGLDILYHPKISGRFSGLTEVGLLPAAIVGLDITEIRNGANEAYESFREKRREQEEDEINPVKYLALHMKEHYDQGFNQILWSMYSKKLIAFNELISQLFHESIAKGEKGFSVLVSEAPENQHHMNQRFFGGPKNMMGIFTTVGSFDEDEMIKAGKPLNKIPLKDGNVGDLDGLMLSKSLKFEFQGVYENAKKNKIPVFWMQLDKVDEKNIGYFTAFMHVLTVYLARAFESNPYDQPQVEFAKNLSFEARRNYKKNEQPKQIQK